MNHEEDVTPEPDEQTRREADPPAPAPKTKWNLTVNDRRFLRSIRIQPDTPVKGSE